MPPPERRASDTSRAYAALVDFAAMGPGRSLEKLVQMWATTGLAKPPTKWLSTLKRWSSEGAWVARLIDYDTAVARSDEAARASVRAARRAALEDRDWTQSNALRDRLDELLLELPKFLRRTESEVKQGGETVRVITLALNTTVAQLASALKLSSDVQRLSVGIATEQIDSNQTIEIRYVDNQPGED